MGFAQVLCRAQAGLAAPSVVVEVHLGSGLPCFNIVGLPAVAVKESRERVRAALATCDYALPAGRITVNLAPADLPKEGGRYDLPIALGILVASGQLACRFDLARTEFYGELGLTGELKAVPGLLLAALHAGQAGHALVVPACNQAEVCAADVEVYGLAHLRELAEGATTEVRAGAVADEALVAAAAAQRYAAGHGARSALAGSEATAVPDLADVRGQHLAKRALLIAAAGGHSLLMLGPPGSGKTMLARRLPGLLPALNAAEALEVAAIAAVAEAMPGATHSRSPVPGRAAITRRIAPPFRSPHHTASAHAIVGGGTAVQPGEVSLAHHGVLFLDELPEFDRRVLESLREPLESGRVCVARANQRAEYPASFQLVAAMNPCPCGRHGLVKPACSCGSERIKRYLGRISGPLLDRIDLQLQLSPVDPTMLIGEPPREGGGLCSAQARELVVRARQRQQERQGCLNARLGAGETLPRCQADGASLALLARTAAERGISARGQHRILRVARSIADLAGRDTVQTADVAEAAALRLEEPEQ